MEGCGRELSMEEWETVDARFQGAADALEGYHKP